MAEGTFGEERVSGWMSRLESVFNRGFWDGYYLGQRLGEWSTTYGSAATKRKIYLGKITNFFSRLSVAEIRLETGSLSVGDELIITGPTTGIVEYTVTGLRDSGEKDADTVPGGELCSVQLPAPVRRSDKVFRRVDASSLRKE